MGMQYDDARKNIKKLGFTISPAGVIRDGPNDYGTITLNAVRDMNGDYVDLDRVQEFYVIGDELRCIVVGNDGATSDHPMAKGHYDERDKEGLDAVTKPSPKTISELNDIIEELYPDIHKMLYYDQLREAEIVDMTLFDRPELGVVRVNDTVTAIYYDNLERRLKEHGYTVGGMPTQWVRDSVFKIKVHENERNPFREWILKQKWDGTPRLRRWFIDTFGATAPALTPEEGEEYIGDVTVAWFMGAISRNFVGETRHEIVPVLIGGQGIGKGLGLKYTSGSDQWFIDTTVDVTNIEDFLDSIRGRIIVELSESTSLRGKDAESLKAFISKSSDQYRKKYARNEEVYPRHFILVASSNLDTIFTDITGNRRYFPFYCNPEIATRKFSQDRTVGQYDVEQLWAEALEMFRSGGKCYLSKKSADRAEIMQRYSSVENPNIVIIENWLDDPDNGYLELGSRISRETIMRNVFNCTGSTIPNKDMENAWRAWTNGTQCWTRMNKSVRVGNKVSRAYERTMAPGGVRHIPRLHIVDGKDELTSAVQSEDYDKVDIYDYFTHIVTERGLSSRDVLSPEGIPAPLLERMLDEGLIYNTRTESNPLYKVVIE